MRYARILQGLVLTGALVAPGCTGTGAPPTPQESSIDTTTTATEVPSAPPSVDVPVDLSSYSQPCSLLTAQQLGELEFPSEASPEQDGQSHRCTWHEDDRDQEAPFVIFAVTIHLTGDPLARVYQEHHSRRGNEEQEWTSFEAHTVRGLPAVTLVRGLAEAQCEVIVGAGNGQGVVVFGSLSGRAEDPGLCDRLVTAAGWVVDAVRR